MPKRPAAPPSSPTGRQRPGPWRWPLGWQWSLLLVLLAVVFVVLRGVHAVVVPPEDTAIFTTKVVVVGVTGRYQLNDTDRSVLGANLDNVQVGAVAVRPRYVGDCAAAGWSTLGAGRRTGVNELCDPQVRGHQVTDWSARLAAAARLNGDAQLGTLAKSVPGCVAAVGDGAALAAARPDGLLASYDTVPTFLARGAKPGCMITLVDAGSSSDEAIKLLARQPDVTLFVTGIGPTPGSDDPGLQVIYRVGTTLPGWLTSASTRRTGVVTLTDLTRTLIDFGHAADPLSQSAVADLPVDGVPLQVDEATLTTSEIEQHLRAVAALSDAVPVGYAILGAGGTLLMALFFAGLVWRRFVLPRLVMAYGATLGAAMMLTGAVDWSTASSPYVLLGLLVTTWSVVLTAAALLLARAIKVPVAIVGAGLVVAAFTVEAALGAVMEPGSLLNSRPIFALRWYGFGNSTFSVYATSGLVLAGFVADRFRRGGHDLAALGAVAMVGFGIVVCEGWPSMGTDFGGVIALTPAVCWLLLALSDVRVTWAKLVAIGGAAVLAIAIISWLDWRRGPDLRSHLGNFVQRIIDGDALDVVSRKAVASGETIIAPLGIVALVGGLVLWLLIFWFVLPVLTDDFTTLRSVAVAVLMTAVLGTLLNDAGIGVWLAVTGVFTILVASLWIDRALTDGHLSWARPASR